MGRSEPEGEKERELARSGQQWSSLRGGGRDAKLTTGERLTKRELNRPKQAYLYKTCVKQNTHAGDYERTGIFILESRRDLGRLYEMAPVRIGLYL